MILIQFNFIKIHILFYSILIDPSFLVMSKLKIILNMLTHAIISDWDIS